MARSRASAQSNSRPGRLRIVAGKWRSRLVPIAEQDGLRPTSERVRETLFNWLAPDINGSQCLDLFAGTGALSFEAVSRGAASATLIEKAPQVVDALRQSAELLNAGSTTIECMDALEYLRQSPPQRFDIVFLDPPFADNLVEECCRLLQSNGWLGEHAAIYIEQEKKNATPELPDGWQISKDKKAGNVRFMLVRQG